MRTACGRLPRTFYNYKFHTRGVMTQYLVTVRARRDAEAPEHLYLLDGELTAAEIQQLTIELLHDSVVQTAAWQPLDELNSVDLPAFAEVAYKPGVTDNESESIVMGARRLGIGGLRAVKTLRRYRLPANTPPSKAFASLYNPLIQTVLTAGA